MGEIGTMVARLQEEGLDLESLIDEEFETAGFVELCSRSTVSLGQRADSIAESQSQLKTLLQTLGDQLKQLQEEESLSYQFEEAEDSGGTPDNDVILIEDDDSEIPGTANEIHQNSTVAMVSNDTKLAPVSGKPTLNVTSSGSKLHASVSKIPLRSPTSFTSSTNSIPGHSPPVTQHSFKMVHTPTSMIPKPLPGTTSVAGVTSRVSQGVLESLGALTDKSSVASLVTLKPSLPAVPPQHIKTPGLSTGSAQANTMETRLSSQPALPSSSPVVPAASPSIPSPPPAAAVFQEPKRPPSPPKFVEGTRVLGKRSDDLWYPGEIIKVQQVRFKVKFDKGTRGLLTSNHIALETHPDASVLCVGSRIVALRPRETAEENASWRKTQEGPYGKLDVLYAGIVAEIACEENKNRFLVFFDDGFAQYLPANKLHHVYHTGEKVWDDVAEHSQEFIQEYLEEFPNRPMVKLTVNRWVKTEWRGKWLKAKVMELDCSLVKMLFQVDNRTEWIYRGSTRLEPLYKALADRSISSSKKSKRSRKVQRDPTDAYVDYSLTKPCFGFSLYSKTDPKGNEQKQIEEKRQETKDEQKQQQKKQIRRDRPSDKSRPSMAFPPASSATSLPSTSSSSSLFSTPVNSTPTPPTTPGSAGNMAPKATPQPNSTLITPTDKLNNMPSLSNNTSPPSMGTNSLSMGQSSTPLPYNSGISSMGNTDFTMGQSIASTSSRRTTRFQPIINNKPASTAYLENGIPSPTTSDVGGDYYSTGSSFTSVGGKNQENSSFPTYKNISGISESTASIIQASNMRKRTTAGLAKKPNSVLHGVEIIELGSDNTLLVTSTASNNLTQSKSIAKNNVNWEAPWKKNNRNNVRTINTADQAPIIKIPVNRNRKHDVAALIQERIWAQKVISIPQPQTEIIPLIPKPPILGPHKCGKHCGVNEQLDEIQKSLHNFFAIPLLCNWKREISRRHPKGRKEVYYRAPCNRRLKSIAEVGQYLTKTNTKNVTIDQFCFDAEISCHDAPFNKQIPIIADISRGTENVPITVVNELDSSYPPPIDYVSNRIRAEGVSINLDPGFLACCDCTDNCQDKSKCSCAQLTIAASAAINGKEDISCGYEHRRLMDSIPTGIYECNQNCACSSQCFNRVVQNGIQLRLQVFKTKSRGWGLRTLDDVPCGTFICTYSGQILNEDMANKEGRDYGDEYLAELDHIEVVEKIKEGYESSVSDLEDDSVIYKTLGTVNSSNTGSASDNSDRGSGSDVESSESDSVISDDSFTSSMCSSTDGSIARKNKREKKKSHKNKRSDHYDDQKGGTVTMNDEQWCVMAAPGNVQPGSIVLRRISTPSLPDNENKDQTLQSDKQKAKKDSDGVSQTSDFDFDDVSDTVYDQLKTIAKTNTANQEQQSPAKNTPEKLNNVNVIDLTSDVEEDMDCTDRKPDIKPVMKKKVINEFTNVFDEFILGVNEVKSIGSRKAKLDDKKTGDMKPSDVPVKANCEENEDEPDFKISEVKGSESEKKDVKSSDAAQGEPRQSEELKVKITAVKGKEKGEATELITSEFDSAVSTDETAKRDEEKQKTCKETEVGVAAIQESNGDENEEADRTSNSQSAEGFDDFTLELPESPEDTKRVHDVSLEDEKNQDGSDSSVSTTEPDNKMDETKEVEEKSSEETSNKGVECDSKSFTSTSNVCEHADKSDKESRTENATDNIKESSMSSEDAAVERSEQKEPDESHSSFDKDISSDSIDKSESNDENKDNGVDDNSTAAETEKPEECDVEGMETENVSSKLDTESTSSGRVSDSKSCDGEGANSEDQQSQSSEDSQSGAEHGSETLPGTRAAEEVKSSEDVDVAVESAEDNHGQESCVNEDGTKEDSERADLSDTAETARVSQSGAGHGSETLPGTRAAEEVKSTEDVDVAVESAEDNHGQGCCVTEAGTKEDSGRADLYDTAETEKVLQRTDIDQSEGIPEVKAVLKEDEACDSDTKNEDDIEENAESPMEVTSCTSPLPLENISTSESGDSVPPLMSADDLSKLAAQMPKPDQGPPKLTKVIKGVHLSNLQDMISRLQSRGVAPDADGVDPVEEAPTPIEDLPLFPPSPSGDVDSFPPSPGSMHSDSSRTDSLEKSSEASFEPAGHHTRLPRRFIITKKGNLQTNVSLPRLFRSGQTGKRPFSPALDHSTNSPMKRPGTRNLFNEEHCYVIDAKAYGNCGRYLNHSCSPNLFVQNVFIDTHDLRFPWVAFFAQHNIPAGSELTWDYMYEVGSVQDKVLRCYCGSTECRGRLL